MIDLNKPDLTQHPPRSPRVRLGGYAILPRMLDKGRAVLAGKNGPYNYNCGLDQRFTSFAGIDADAMLEQLKQGKNDSEILEWVNANAKNQPNIVEILQFSTYAENNVPTTMAAREYFANTLGALSKTREDIRGWFDLLDLDDYVSYGGKP
jgi:hypothetical protein